MIKAKKLKIKILIIKTHVKIIGFPESTKTLLAFEFNFNNLANHNPTES
jgi:hypothetical protein